MSNVSSIPSGSTQVSVRYWRRGDAVTNAVWNDLAEYRKSSLTDAGYVITPSGDLSTQRLAPGCRIISDTWGFALGESTEQTQRAPVGISGRVLAYTYRPREEYQIGDCVCSAPNGTIDIMTREEVREYPDRILGIVNEIPDYDTYGYDETQGGGRPTRYRCRRPHLDRYQVSNFTLLP